MIQTSLANGLFDTPDQTPPKVNVGKPGEVVVLYPGPKDVPGTVDRHATNVRINGLTAELGSSILRFDDPAFFGNISAMITEPITLDLAATAITDPSAGLFTFTAADAGAINLVGPVRSYVGPVNVDPIARYTQYRTKARVLREDALSDLRRQLDAARLSYARANPREVTHFLTDDLGVGQLTVARALRVSPTAVRKWGRGEVARPENRTRLADLAALSALLNERSVHDPGGWLDMPISIEGILTPLDLFVGGRADLAAAVAFGVLNPQDALEAFDGHWRDNYPVDHNYEVITLADGSRSAVPRAGRDAG